MIYLTLFWEFFKIGLFAIGGGPATVPFLIDLSLKFPNWFSVKELADMIAVSQSTPGPIGINMATYVGNTVASVFGGVVATLGEIIPSLIIIMLISRFLIRFKQELIVQNVLLVIRPVALGLLTFAWLSIAKISLFDGAQLLWINFIVFIALFILILKFKNWHPLIWIFIGAAVGIFFL